MHRLSFPLLAALRARRAPAGAAPAVLAFLAAALAASFAAPFADLGAEAKAAEASQASLPGRIAALAPPSPAALADPPYRRRQWLPRWSDADGDCMNTRHEILQARSLVPVALDARGCRVASGLWRAFYSGRLVSDPSELEVDHLVALKEAHESGRSGLEPCTAAGLCRGRGQPRPRPRRGQSGQGGW